jgi:YHYH protein
MAKARSRRGLLAAFAAGMAAAICRAMRGGGVLASAHRRSDGRADVPALTRLPLGDGELSNAPSNGYVWACQGNFGPGGATAAAPWIHDDGTFDLTAKPVVQGAVSWTSQLQISLDGDRRIVQTNGLPDHPTGTFPIIPSDPAYQYDRNPNSIAQQPINFSLPAAPQFADSPSCLPQGPIGVLLTGAMFFNALDAGGRDAVAHELQDSCSGHPNPNGIYHYHSLTNCLDDDGAGHSSLVGYALDGFGVYGLRGEDGSELTNADLDSCHGHTHTIEWDEQSVELYHYHATREYPYMLGCFRGMPLSLLPQGRP